MGRATMILNRTKSYSGVVAADASPKYRNTPLATIALLSFGLGIGANTAIFSLIHTLMLRLLPVRDPQQLPSVPKASIRKSWDTWRVTSSRSLGSSWQIGRAHV